MNKAIRKGDHPVEKVSRPKTTAGYGNGLPTQPLVVLLVLSSLVIYSNTFSSSFHFDDEDSIVENPWIKNLSNVLDLSAGRYVGLLSFALNYHFGQLNPLGYHLVNLLIHIANGLLVYTLVMLLFMTPLMRSSSSVYPQHSAASIQQDPAWTALTTALLFVVHPIQTQAVTYIVQRFTSLATLFYLLSVVCYLKWRLVGPNQRSLYGWYAGAWIATVFAMKTKEISFTLPFMILLIEGVFFWPLTRKQWVALIPFLLTLPMIPLSSLGTHGEAEGGVARETTDISRLDYLFTQFRVIVTYLRLLVFPVHQNLDYDYPIYHSLLNASVFLSMLFLAFLLGLAIYLLFWSRHRLVAFGLLWFFLTLSVESSIIPISDVIFEHRLYLPSVGFMLAASATVVGFLHLWRMTVSIVIGVTVVVFSVATYQRNLIWKDNITLWTNVIQESPNKARGYTNLGAAYRDQHRIQEAIQAYKTAIALLTLRPGLVQAKHDLAKAHNILGNTYQMLGRLEDALQEYKTALILKPNLADAHNNLGIAYGKLGRLEEAVQEYKTALTLSPGLAETHYNLGLTYYKDGKLSEAIVELEKAIKFKPDYVQAHNILEDINKHNQK